MGKSSSVTIGFKYLVAYHHGLAAHPIDAFLEFRAANKTAWAGKLTSSGTIGIYAPSLFGGDKDQGGIVGAVDVMFGEDGQQPNAYLLSTFGSQVPSWQGMTTLVFKGGEFGAMNPYPQKPAYKILAIEQGWDDACWYPEKAAVAVVGSNAQIVMTDFSGFETNAPTMFQLVGGAIENTTLDATRGDYWRTPLGLAGVTDLYCEFQLTADGTGDPITIAITDAGGNHILDFCPLTESVTDPQRRPAIDYFGTPIPIYGSVLATATPYSFEASINQAAGTFTYWLRQGATVLSTGTAALHAGTAAFLAFTRSANDSTTPAISLYTLVRLVGLGTAMNPAHILYEVRTARDRGQEPTANMADANWRAGADWFYNQGFGLCQCAYDADAESVDEFSARISQLAACSVSRDPVDGLWYLDIANGVYDLNSLPILTDDDILEFEDSPTLLDDSTNSVAVEYFDPEQWTTVTTRPVTALALISANGLNHVTHQYPEVPTGDLANRLAQRNLMAAITPSHAFSITTTRKPYAWRRNTYFRLQSPKNGIADMVCILAEKSDGTLKSGAMKITAAQNTFSLASASYMETERGVDTRPPQVPLAIVSQAAFEAPYFELVRNLSRANLAALPGDVGYLVTIATDPAQSRDYSIVVSTDGGATYVELGNGSWCPTALIVEGDTLQAGLKTEFTLAEGSLLASVLVGSAALWDGEICRVDAMDAVANTLTLGRGCADTPPREHAPNSRIWFFDGFAGSGTTEYTDGETISVKLLTNTFSQQLNAALATPIAVAFDARQNRPYPPAGLTINEEAYPAAAIRPLAIAWTHRDRIQQADQLIDTSQASIGPETNVTYTVRTYLDDVLAQTLPDIAGTTASPEPGGFGTVRIEVDAVRDGVPSFMPLAATFDYRSDLTITTPATVQLASGAAGTYQMQASGGLPPLAWSVDPTTQLPDGMTMSSDGLISYDATVASGATDVTFDVEDAAGSSASATITLELTATFLGLVDSLAPVAHWRMNEASGTTLVDRVAEAIATLSGSAGVAYFLGQPGLLEGDADTAVRIASGGASTTANAKWALGDGDYSIFLISKWTTTTLATLLSLRGGSSSTILFDLFVNYKGTNNVAAVGNNFNTTGAIANAQDKAYNDGLPHAVGVTYDATAQTLRLYVDGILKATSTASVTRAASTWDSSIQVGIGNNFGANALAGTFDEVVLFDHKLTDTDMANLASFAATS